MNIWTLNGCVFLGASISRLLDIPILAYLTSIFCIVLVYKLFRLKHKTSLYIYSILVILYYCFSLYYTVQ